MQQISEATAIRILQNMAKLDGVTFEYMVNELAENINKLPIGHWKYFVMDNMELYRLSRDEAEAALRYAEDNGLINS